MTTRAGSAPTRVLLVSALVFVAACSSAGTARAQSGTSRTGGRSSPPAQRTKAVTTTTTAPQHPNPPEVPPRAAGPRPSVALFGDSVSTDARDVLLFGLQADGYDVSLYKAAYGAQLCIDGPTIPQTIKNLAPAAVILQSQANGSYWGCVEGYDANRFLYTAVLGEVAQAAASSGRAGGTRVFLVTALPNSDGSFNDPASVQGATDAERDWANRRPDIFTVVDATAGLTPGPGALQTCYPAEPGCRWDGKIQVRDDDRNVVTGITKPGGGEHLCPLPQIVSLSETHCLVENAGARRLTYTILGALRTVQ